MIKNIILDWHGVLDKTSPKTLSPYLLKLFFIQLFKFNLTACKQILFIVFDKYSDLINDYNRDTIAPNEFWKLIYDNLGEKLGADLKAKTYQIEINSELVNFLKTRSENKYLLSDCSKDKKKIILNKLPDVSFRNKFFSCDSKTLKRDQSLFKFAINAEKIEPKNSLFIDDSMKNIEVAKDLGFKTFLFTGTKNNLITLKLLLNE